MATIVIDPGHYGLYNPGICQGYYESQAMLRLSRHLGTALSTMGATVRYTRTADEENPSLAQRGAMAQGADLFISLHSDASENPDIRGVTTYMSVQRPQSEALGAAIGQAAANAMRNEFRGTIARESETQPGVDYLGVLRAAAATDVPYAFLIEHGFHTNELDCQLLSSDEELMRIAYAEAQIIGQHFGLNFLPPACNCRFYYSVRWGESLYLIGRKFDVPWQSIAAVNGIRSPYIIYPGQRIIIPLISVQ